MTTPTLATLIAAAASCATRSVVLALVVLLLGALPGTAADPQAVGRLVELEADGLPSDAGRWVAAGTRPLIVLDRPAELELIDGPTLRLEANTAVVIEGPPNDLTLNVLSGRVRLAGPDGRELIGGAGGRFSLGRLTVRTPGSEAGDDAAIDDHERRVRGNGR